MKLLIIGARGFLADAQTERQEDKAIYFQHEFDALGMTTRVFYHRDLVREHPGSRVKQAANLVLDRLGVSLRFDALKAADESLLRVVDEFKPDALFAHKGETLRPTLLRALKAEHGVRYLVNMFPDNPFLYDDFMLGIDAYDEVFFKDTQFVDQIRAMGYNRAQYLPQCFSPVDIDTTTVTPAERETFRCDLSLVGNLYPHRVLMLRALSEFTVKVWGRPTEIGGEPADSPLRAMHQGRPLAGRERTLAYTLPPCSLNTHHPLNDPRGLNGRDFDIAGNGGLLLTSSQPELSAMLRPGTECISYASVEELKERLRHILANPESYETVRSAAKCRCLAEHTYAHRAAVIAEAISR